MRHPLRVLQVIAIVAISSLPVSAAFADSVSPPRPAVAKHFQGEAFPPAEKRRNHEGSVLVEFSIDAKGRTNRVEAIESSSAQFSEAVKVFLKGTRFKV